MPVTEVSPPQYTVSASHPLPSGVSAAQVAKDVEIDNLIENIAIEKGDPALLAYADCGAWLQAITREIRSDQAEHIRIVSITDSVALLKVGYQPDPQDSQVTAAAIVSGTEVQRRMLADGASSTKVTHFNVIRWVLWSATNGRYLTCDTGQS